MEFKVSPTRLFPSMELKIRNLQLLGYSIGPSGGSQASNLDALFQNYEYERSPS
jgi:hypothetical protein